MLERELRELFGTRVELVVRKGEIAIVVLEAKDLIMVMKILYYHTGLEVKSIIDITGVDYLIGNKEEIIKRSKRFDVVYNLLSVRYSRRIKVKVAVDDLESVDTITGIYKGSDWLEREVYDLMGIYFKGHKDLRRIMTDYGFEGHPLRKDYGLTGYYEMKYDEVKKRVSVENRVVVRS